MDALAHCLESYCSNFFHPFSQGIALEGMFIVKNNLINAYHDGSNLDARGSMLAASSMGSIAFQKGLGAIHSLSHPVGAMYNTHHGLTNAVFMPYVLRRNKKVIEEKIISLSRYLNLEDQTFEGFMNWILYLRKELSIPHTLKELIQDDSKFEEMSKMAKNDPSTGGNPITLEIKDFYNLYKDSFSGIL
jgi:alcohol dehydrogenase class IV